MRFAEIEKERLKATDWWWLLEALLVLWYATRVLSAFSAATIYNWETKSRTLELAGLYVPYLNRNLFLGILFLGIYMNSRLFWITERNEKVFLMRKYDLAPVTGAEIYQCKAKIFAKRMGSYLGLTMIVYLAVLAVYGLNIEVIRTAGEAAAGLLSAAAVMAVLFVLNWVQDIRTMKRHRL